MTEDEHRSEHQRFVDWAQRTASASRIAHASREDPDGLRRASVCELCNTLNDAERVADLWDEFIFMALDARRYEVARGRMPRKLARFPDGQWYESRDVSAHVHLASRWLARHPLCEEAYRRDLGILDGPR